MKVLVEIDTLDLLEHTSREQDKQIADDFICNATDEALVDEIAERNLFDEVFDRACESDKHRIFEKYADNKQQ